MMADERVRVGTVSGHLVQLEAADGPYLLMDVFGGEDVHLSPGDARKLAAELMRLADLAEKGGG
jgi:hypothetical protein